ncbi:hypothetical protein [Halopseudomonas sabulinigri]|uniref:hypothetical protein n=1 Tax=Halopseudomonas sabulinigri TaxID=472181 RepID=UPI001E40E114|nr:hypothetical protein [Halopseudomonas sabulinigri]
MARRMTKAESKAVGVLAIIALPVLAVVKLFETVGWVIPVAAVVVAIALFIWYQRDKKKRRLTYLREKYDNEEVVQKIFQGYFWQGQSEEQLRDALGPPTDIDNKLLKTKTRDVWKYHHQGGNRFGLRITVENGYVTGWDKKV